MSSRIDEMRSFLKRLALMKIQNPDSKMSHYTVYNQLKSYGFSKEEKKDRSIENLINPWIERYKDNENINVYNTDIQRNFLQFSYGEEKYSGNHYKLYFSFKKDKVNEAVCKLFDFVADNKMVHFSKVAKEIRADVICLRLAKTEDLNKVLSFVLNDVFFINNAQPTNPFLGSTPVCGLGLDRGHSYNLAISNVIYSYIQENYYKGLDQNTVSGLAEFTSNYRKKLMTDMNSVFSYIETQEEYDAMNDEGMATDLMYKTSEILETFECVLNNDLSVKKYTEIYDKYASDEYVTSFCERFSNLYNEDIFALENYNSNIYKSESKDDALKEKFINKMNVINSYFSSAEEKYNVHVAAKQLRFYSSTKNSDYITRTNNMRDKIDQEFKNDDFKKYIGDNDFDITKYAYQYYLDMHEDKVKTFNNACLATLNKYGERNFFIGLKKALDEENFIYFTNDYGCRDKLINNVSPNHLEDVMICYLINSGVQVDNVINDVIERDNAFKKDDDLYRKLNEKIHNELVSEFSLTIRNQNSNTNINTNTVSNTK